MPPTNKHKKLCEKCGERQQRQRGLCYKCLAETPLAPPEKTPTEIQLDDIIKQALQGDSVDWEHLAIKMQPVMLGIAAGTIKATPAQASILKEINDRGFGKVSANDEKEDLTPHGVVVLPAIGQMHNAQICPDCMRFHESGHAVVAEPRPADGLPDQPSA